MKILRGIGILLLCLFALVITYYAIIGFACMHLTVRMSPDEQHCMITKEYDGRTWCMDILREKIDER